jgi:hypothetical protein
MREVIIVLLIIMVFSLSGCVDTGGDNPEETISDNNDSVLEDNVIPPDSDDPIAQSIIDSEYSEVRVIYDNESDTMCYSYDRSRGFGLSCLPVEDSRYSPADFE